MQLINYFIVSLYTRFQEMKKEAGQTLVEYGLIVALISIVAIGALALVGDEVTAVFNEVGGVLGGGGEGA